MGLTQRLLAATSHCPFPRPPPLVAPRVPCASAASLHRVGSAHSRAPPLPHTVRLSPVRARPTCAVCPWHVPGRRGVRRPGRGSGDRAPPYFDSSKCFLASTGCHQRVSSVPLKVTSEGSLQLLKPAIGLRRETKLVGAGHDVEGRILELVRPLGVSIVPNHSCSSQGLLSPLVARIVAHPRCHLGIEIFALSVVSSAELIASDNL